VSTPRELLAASSIAGGLTGGVMGFLIRGKSNAAPGAIMFSLAGFAGQAAFNTLSARSEITEQEPKPNFWKRMSEKSWSPVTIMSDEEYAALLREKMIKVDAELSILDDRIAALRKEQRQRLQTREEDEPASPNP
jgi:hypothetical protein